VIALHDSARLTWKEISRHVHVDFRADQVIYTRGKWNDIPSNPSCQGRPELFDANIFIGPIMADFERMD
jgi:hypothetical protein